jgi:hypothetical protein
MKNQKDKDEIVVSRTHKGKKVQYNLSEKLHEDMKKIGIDSYHELGVILDEIMDDVSDEYLEIFEERKTSSK